VEAIMKMLIVATALLLVSGCAQWTAGRTAIRGAGAAAMDEAVDVSVSAICNDFSTGSSMRRWASSEELWNAWLTICGRRGGLATYSRPVTP